MLDWTFKGNAGARTGIYRFSDGRLIELDEEPGNGSVNSIIEELGFSLSQVHPIYTFDSEVIECIGFKIFTKQAVFVLAKENSSGLTTNVVDQEIKRIDWDSEYSSLNVEAILNEGIDSKSLNYDFLSSITQLVKDVNNVYHAPSLGLYLNFENELLDSFASAEWSNSASRWLKDLNESMFSKILSEAKKYHDNEMEAMEEVNLQCDSLLEMPQALKNEFIPLHMKLTGNINFYNLLAVHYNFEIPIQEFKIVNKGRFILKDENKFEVDGFYYQFGSNGKLTAASSSTI